MFESIFGESAGPRRESRFRQNHKKDINVRRFFILVSLLFFLLTFAAIITSVWQSDLMWTVATGDEILTNGIPRTNPFTIDEMGIVVQQWMFDVLAALFSRMGYVGYYLFGSLNGFILIAAMWLYLSQPQYRIKNLYKAVFVSILAYLIIKFSSSTRPEELTLALLIVTCFAMERFKAAGKIRYLFILPAAVLIEANFHSSMVWFHFAVIATYMVPSALKKFCSDTGLNIKAVLLFFAASFGAAFINPYGAAGIMYFPNSMMAGTFRYVAISEMQPLLVSGNALSGLLMVGVLIFLIYYLAKNGHLISYQFYIAAGFIVILFFANRNILFLFVSIITLLPEILKECGDGKIRVKAAWFNVIIMRMTILCLVLTLVIIPAEVMDAVSESDKTMAEVASDVIVFFGLDEFDDYIRNECDDIKTVKLYTEFDNGAYFEYLGYRNIYMDPRPELYMKKINKTKDILPTYSIFSSGDEEEVFATAPSFLDEYDFDYLVVQKKLGDYLDTLPDEYEMVMDSTFNKLYKHIKQE